MLAGLRLSAINHSLSTHGLPIPHCNDLLSGALAMKRLLMMPLSLLLVLAVLAGPGWSALHRRQPPRDPQAGPAPKAHTLHHHADRYAPRKPPHPHKMPKPPKPAGKAHKLHGK
jgi:hypothetical protein